MQLVEKHVIKQGHRFYQEIDQLCFLSKNLYNVGNYLIRQTFINSNESLSYYDIQKQLQSSVDYKALPSKVSQQVLMVLDRNWKSFKEALKSWFENQSRFLGKPKLPKYKHKTNGRNIVIYTKQALSKPALERGVIKPSKTNIELLTKSVNIAQVRIVPKLDHYVIEVVYNKEVEPASIDVNKIAAIDLGLSNLATVTFNQAGIAPLLINGSPLKAMNQFFNKQKANWQSIIGTGTTKRIQKLCTKRHHKVDDYMHKASRFIINKLLGLGVDTLVIGKNENWKQEINIGSRNNQNFGQIPHSLFINKLTYKAELIGIKVLVTEESYTSKASFLDLDNIPTYQEGVKHTFSGKRIIRGLYKSADGRMINADVNGSYNIMRKAVPNAFANGIEGIVVCPVKVKLPN